MTDGLRLLLLASDDAAAFVANAVRAAGHDCATHSIDSAASLAALLPGNWDAVVVDLEQEGIDAASALATIRSRDPFVTVILISAVIDTADAIGLVKAGADDLVERTSPERLVLAIQRGLRDASVRRVAAEEADRFRATFEQTAVGIVHATPHGEIRRVNRRFAEMLGYEPGELIGRTLRDITYPGDIVMDAETLERRIGPGNSLSFEKRFLRKDGARLWSTITVAAATLPATGERYMIGVAQDTTARTEAEEKLRQSESRYRELLEQASDGIFIIGPDLRFTAVNERGCEIGGRTREQIIGLHVSEVLTDLENSPIQLDDLRLGRSVLRERTFVRPDGTLRSVEISSRLLPDGSIQSIVRDITARKEADEKLRESEERFRMIFEATNDAIFDWYVKDRSIWMNDRMRQIIGTARANGSDHIGWWLDHVHAEDRERVLGRTLAALSGSPDAEPSEYRFIRDDGVTVHLRQRTFVIFDEEGSATRIVGTITDVTGTRLAEEALVRSEDRFRALIEGSHDAILVLSSEGVPTYCSPSMYRIIGYQPSEIVGRTDMFADIHPDDQERVSEAFRRIVEGDESLHVEYRYRHRDGTWRWLEAVGRNMLAVPAVAGIVANYRDITERRAWQRRLDQAERLSSLGRLAATIAHEFNNVLMGIQPFAEVLRRRLPDDERVVNACSHIENSVRRGRSITQEILRFTHAVEPEISSMNAAAWVAEVGAELRALLPPAVQFRIVSPSRRCSIAADRSQLTQAITNLVLNARDAMPDGGTITLAVDTEPAGSVITTSDIINPADFVHVTVRDDGPGIPPGVQQRIFEPLFTTKKGGTGLGLPVVHQIVTRHGGHIFVESAQGSGTTFHLMIPRAANEERAAEPPAPLPRTRGRGARVLLVEDEIAVADGLSTILEMEGYLVRAVHTGGEATSALDAFSPDLVVLDIGLPDIDGYQLYEKLSPTLHHVPVIFSTGHGDATKLEELSSKERTRFLRKPYSSDALLSLMDEVLSTAC